MAKPSVLNIVVRMTGLEPARLAVQEPKSCASASFATSAVCGRAGRIRTFDDGVKVHCLNHLATVLTIALL